MHQSAAHRNSCALRVPRRAPVPRVSAASMIEPRRVLRLIYIGRLSLAAAIFFAAVFSWHGADGRDTLLATLALFAAIAFTSLSAWFGLAYRHLVARGFYYAQS